MNSDSVSYKNVEKRIKNITSTWFYDEPLLYSVYCTHNLIPNDGISVPFRCGQRRIEFSPSILNTYESDQIENFLKIEIYRILLQHPYSRQPSHAQKGILLIASDVTIYHLLGANSSVLSNISLPGVEYLKNQAVRFGMLEHPLGLKWIGSEELKFFQRNLQIDHNSGALVTVDDLSFEQWYRKILFLITETSIAGENAGTDENDNLSSIPSSAADLWEEDQEAQKEISDQIKKAEAEQGWGGLGGNLQRTVADECTCSFDYRRALSQFRASIVSSSRSLTRMKPNRRYGLKAMGSRYERKANILIAVDVSGSITDEMFNNFYHIIKNIFFLGIIEKIDVIFFDVNLKNSKPVTINKKIELKNIQGRGGTNFQPALDFYFENKSTYNGLIIFTDGEGPIPQINQKMGKSNILWILSNRLSYEKSRQWVEALPGNKATYLPF